MVAAAGRKSSAAASSCATHEPRIMTATSRDAYGYNRSKSAMGGAK